MNASSHRRAGANVISTLQRSGSPAASTTGMRLPAAASHDEAVRCIGWSEEGRPITVQSVGPMDARVRIAIVAGQHGDERLASVAAEAAIRHARLTLNAAGRPIGDLARIELVRSANPDGAARRRRTNARGVDLNRDHLELETSEARTLHAWIARLRPDVVIDVHAYPSRRAWLGDLGLRHAGDACIDWSGCPAASADLLSRGAELGRRAIAATARRGWRTDRYLVASGRGVPRPSSPTPATLLNAATVRFGSVGILVEAREPAPDEVAASRDRATDAATDAIVEVMRAATEGAAAPRRATSGVPSHVAVSGRWERSGPAPSLWVHGRHDRRVRKIDAPGRPRTRFVASTVVEVPTAYGMPLAPWSIPIIERLRRLGLDPAPAPGAEHRIEQAVVTSVVASRRRDRAARRISARWTAVSSAGRSGWCWWNARHDADAARTLALLMEPESRFGLLQHGQVPLPGPSAPIRRAVASASG